MMMVLYYSTMQLNPQQQEAVSNRKGACLVVSVPGSGKTRVIVERTTSMIREGIPPHRIVSLTFTNKAAGEMKERVSKSLGASSPRMFMGTFHSLCSHILRKFASECGIYPKFTIMDESDQTTLMKKISKRLHGGDFGRVLPPIAANVVNNARENLGDVEGECMKMLIGILGNQITAEMHMDVISEYLIESKQKGLIDFSGLLYEVVTMMETNEKVRKFLQDSHDFLQVDEVQDTNLAQFRLVELLGECHGNIFIVGDLNQSIYGWRGARYRNITDFMERDSGCKVIELGQNYRSTPQITSRADALISHNESNMGAGIITAKGDGDPVRYRQFSTNEEEANLIVTNIRNWCNSGLYKPSDIAVLYRVNSMSRSLEEACMAMRVPYKVIGGFSFYDRSEVKDCLAMLRMCVNPHDTVAFTRISDFMPGMGTKSVYLVENASAAHNIGIAEACVEIVNDIPASGRESCAKFSEVFTTDYSSMNAGQALGHIVNELNYEGVLKKSSKSKVNDRIDNVQELVTSAMAGENSGLGIQEYLHKLQLLTSSDQDSPESQVSLMTMHASKGLEFPVVFVVGLEENMVPHERSVSESADGLEEERRLLYVAMTRAEDKLFLSSCKSRRKAGGRKAASYSCIPSRFLKEAGILK